MTLLRDLRPIARLSQGELVPESRMGASQVALVLITQHLVAFRKVIWGSSIAKDPPTVTCEEAMTDRGLFKWLSKVVSHRITTSRREPEF